MSSIADIAAFAQRLTAIERSARQQGYEFGDIIGYGCHGVVLVARGPQIDDAVVKLPLLWPGPQTSPHHHAGPRRLFQLSETGPFALETVTEESARELLLEAITRQAKRPCRVLADILGQLECAGTPAVLYERLGDPHRSAGRYFQLQDAGRLHGFFRDLAGALRKLHREFGAHGDLEPNHIFCVGPASQPRLIDPLCHGHWFGSLGYTLGWAPFDEPGDQARRVHDLGALVAIIARLFGGDLGWAAHIRVLANRHSGYFDQEASLERLRRDLIDGLRKVPEPLHSWAIDTGHAYIDNHIDSGSPRRSLDNSWCERRLTELSRS